MKRINLYLPDDLVQRLTLQAEKEGANFSSLTRRVLSEFLDRQGAPDKLEHGSPSSELAEFSKSVLGRLDRMQDAQTDIKAILDLILHYAKRSTDRS